MIKFFRKHTKKLLAIFMALLLIVWLGGSALESLLAGSTSDRVFAHTAFGDIVELDQRIANGETTLLSHLGINWRVPLLGLGQTEPLGVTEWILLSREAERYGIGARKVEVEQFLNEIGITPERVIALAQRDDVKVETIYDAVGQYMAVRQAANLALTASIRSEAELRLAARNELDKVKINLVSFRASSMDIPDTSFTDEEIEEHFNKYRDRQRGQGLEFGYVQPAQVKLQYFLIHLAEVAANVRVHERTLESRAREYWRQNRETPQFLKPPEPEPDKPEDTDPEASDASDGSDAESPDDATEASNDEEPKSPYFETFEEARDIAIQAVRRELGEKEIDDIAGWLLRQVAEPWYDAPKGDDGYKVAPQGVADAGHYAAILDRLPAGLRYGQAVTIGTTEFFSQQNMSSKAPLVAAARLPEKGPGGSAQLLRNLVFHAQGIEPMPSDPGASTSEYLARWQSCPQQFVVYDGDRFIYRVIDVKPPGPAESLDEVRDLVLADLRLQRAFEEAERVARRLESLAAGAGLKAAFDGDDEIQALTKAPSGYYTPAPIARRREGTAGRTSGNDTIYVSGVGLVGQDFVEKCFALGKDDAPSRIAVIPVESAAAVTIVEWVENEPLREDTYEAERTRLAAQIGRNVVTRSVGEWLDPVRIRDRCGFTYPTQ